MYIIKLDAIDSTNAYLKQLATSSPPKDFTVVVAKAQTKGRGQMGTVWESEASKNLTFSVFKDVSYLNVSQRFYVSMATSLAIVNALSALHIPKLRIKWPNDILSENKKIGGILIESIIKNNTLQGTIIGIGLNINQRYFDNLPQASSLFRLTGVIYNTNEVFQRILNHLDSAFKDLKALQFIKIHESYEKVLFRRKKPSTFKTPNGKCFSGYIEGVTHEGKLQVLLEDDMLMAFDLKAIQLLY